MADIIMIIVYNLHPFAMFLEVFCKQNSCTEHFRWLIDYYKCIGHWPTCFINEWNATRNERMSSNQNFVSQIKNLMEKTQYGVKILYLINMHACTVGIIQ